MRMRRVEVRRAERERGSIVAVDVHEDRYKMLSVVG